jgi:putative transposase
LAEYRSRYRKFRLELPARFGVPVGLAIDGANRHDCKMTKATIKSIPVKRPKPTKRKKQGMCLDKGYDSGEVRDLVKAFGYTAHIRLRGEEAQAIKHEAGFKSRRWVVERTHSWMNRFRHILRRWEKNLKIICLCFILSVP